MDGVTVLPVFLGFLKDQNWVPLLVLALAVVIYLMLKDQRKQLAARELDSKQREETLNALVKDNTADSKKREKALNELIEETKRESKEREEQVKAEALAREERSKEESRIREERLMNHLDQQGAVQTRMVSTLEMIQTRMEFIERAVNIDPKVIVKVEKDGGIIT
ncbi:MAG: hypothetical protein ABS894_00705 [Aerococcus urinaeequi]